MPKNWSLRSLREIFRTLFRQRFGSKREKEGGIMALKQCRRAFFPAEQDPGSVGAFSGPILVDDWANGPSLWPKKRQNPLTG